LFEEYCPVNSTTAMAEKSFTALFPIENFCIEGSEHQIHTGSDVV
jgi:hypothetical protein